MNASLRWVGAGFLSLLMAGCAAPRFWYGASPEKDLYECSMEAASWYAPVMYRTQVGSGYVTPTQTECREKGNTTRCRTTGGHYVPPSQVTLDANDQNRNQHIRFCMNSRGNQLMTAEQHAALQGPPVAPGPLAGGTAPVTTASPGPSPAPGQPVALVPAPEHQAIDQLIEAYEREMLGLTQSQKRIQFRELCRNKKSAGYPSIQCQAFRKMNG